MKLEPDFLMLKDFKNSYMFYPQAPFWMQSSGYARFAQRREPSLCVSGGVWGTLCVLAHFHSISLPPQPDRRDKVCLDSLHDRNLRESVTFWWGVKKKKTMEQFIRNTNNKFPQKEEREV